ncbi:conserved hypothetical protein [Candidatus Sulfopaludibacter sp. SbA4]|nr:conserved hypothetical protein [Candidatus Sulfopaludibacter sp. SbA4]
MATDKQTEANRQNAQKSTGPRTAEGKARSSMNHLITGIDAKSAIIPGENPAALQALIERTYTRFQPATDEERHHVDTVIWCDWQSQRFIRSESEIWRSTMESPLRRKDPNPVGYGYSLCPITFSRLDRRVEVNERLYTRALHELERLQSNRFATEAATEVEDAAAEPAPQPTETEAPTEELGSNPQNAPDPRATPAPAPNPTPATPKFGPESASDPLGTPDEAPPKSA